MDMTYQHLVSYKEEPAGSTLVPSKHDKDPQLANWVHKRRKLLKKKEVPRDRVTLLKSIDFAWNGKAEMEAKENSNWMGMYQRLISYKEEHDGSTMVPSKYDAYPQLGHWVHRQRILLKKKELPKDRVTLLKSIDFA